MSSRLQGLAGLLAVEAAFEPEVMNSELLEATSEEQSVDLQSSKPQSSKPQSSKPQSSKPQSSKLQISETQPTENQSTENQFAENQSAQLQGLDLPLLNGNAPVLILLSKIQRSRFQPRSFFNQDKIQKMANKFREYRQRGSRPKTIILVRPIPETDQYELVFGEQRKIAHEKAGYEEIMAFVDATITDEEARELALTENLLREDLNPVERTEATLDLAAVRIGSTPEGVKQLLDKAANERKHGTDNVTRTEQWQKLEAFFQELPDKVTPESFRTNHLPLLRLPADILQSLHQGEIEYTKAKVISRIKNADQRQRFLRKVVQQNLSIRDIRAEINAQKAQESANESANESDKALSIPQRLEQLSRQVKKKTWRSSEQLQEIETLIDKLEELVQFES